MEFKTKTADELKGLTVDELAGYYNDLNTHKNAERDELIKSKADQKSIDELTEELSKMKDTQLKAMQAQIEAQQLAIKKMSVDSEKDVTEDIYLKALGEVCTQLQTSTGMYKIKGNDGKPLQLKTVGAMTVANNASTVPIADRRQGVNTLLERPLVIRDLANVYQTSTNKVEWVYELTEEGGAAMTAEGVAKTQSDRNWAVGSASAYKLTTYVKVTKEMLMFLNNIKQNIDNRLMYLINELEDDYLLTGTGSSQLMGVTQNAQPLDNASLKGTIPGLDANVNIWDCAGAMISQVISEAYGPIQRGAFIMHPTDVYKMVYGSKSSTYDYVYPVTVDPSGVRIGGYPIIQDTGITAGYMVFGDFAKFNIADVENVTVTMGYDGNDFTENKVTIVGEKLLASYVMQNDYNFFVYDAIADMKVFLSIGS